MNITEETNNMEALLKAMEEKDKTVEVKPQEVCNLDDEGCISCSG